VDDTRSKYLENATPGPWFVGSCRTWTEEQKVIAAIPLLMELFREAQRVASLEGSDLELDLAVSRVRRALNR